LKIKYTKYMTLFSNYLRLITGIIELMNESPSN
jgi:hypothetical protein